MKSGALSALAGGSRGRRGAAIAACAWALILVSTTPAHAALPSGNLLQNPGAEAGSCAHDTSTPPAIPSWTTTPNFTVLCYEDNLTLEPGLAGGENGNNYFMGGNEEETTATQTVDVSSFASEIDAGSAQVNLAADLGGFESQNDNMTIMAIFLSGSEQPLGSQLRIGPVIASERNEESKLVHREGAKAVPVGTRSIRVVMIAVRTEGSDNDGSADNLSLTLTAGGGGSGGGGGGGGGGGPGPSPIPPSSPPLQVGQLGVPNPLSFKAPPSTGINPLFSSVASHGRKAAIHGVACSPTGCGKLDKSVKNTCETAIGGNPDLALTAPCLKLIGLHKDPAGGLEASYISGTPVSANGVEFSPGQGTVSVTQRTGSNGAQQFVVHCFCNVWFESTLLDHGQLVWTLDQLPGFGFGSSYSGGGANLSGQAPVPPNSRFNGLEVASATMPVFKSGHASSAITLRLPPEFGGATTTQSILISNGSLAKAVSAGDQPLFATGTAAQDAQNCEMALSQPIPSGPNVLTISLPQFSYHGLSLRKATLTVAGTHHFLARLQATLPYPSETKIEGVIEVYQGHLRFGCVTDDYGSGVPMPGLPVWLKRIALGFASDDAEDVISGQISMIGGVPVPGYAHPIASSGKLVVTIPPSGSANPWTLAIKGDTSVTGFGDTAGSVAYASSGYLKASLHTSEVTVLGIGFEPGYMAGAMDPHGNWLMEGEYGVKFLGLSVFNAASIVSNIGLGACGGVTGGHAGFTTEWSGGFHLIGGFGTCETTDLSAVAPAIEATCQELEFLAHSPTPIVSQPAQQLLNEHKCVNVPGSASSVGAQAATASRARRLSGGPGDVIPLQSPAHSSQNQWIFHGAGGAPDVVLVGGGRRRIATPAPGSTATGDAHSVGVRDEQTGTTMLTVAKMKPGAWLAEIQPDSVPVTSVGIARVLPRLVVHAAVRHGRRSGTRVLNYRIPARHGRTVIFVERAKGGLMQRIGRVHKSRGSLTFIPLDGPAGRRTIVALSGPKGLPVHQQTVTHFHASKRPKLAAPRWVKISAAKHQRATATFAKVPGAGAYTVSVSLSDGQRWTEVDRRRKVRIAGLAPGHITAKVSVAGLDSAGRTGRHRSARRGLAIPVPRAKLPAAAHGHHHRRRSHR